MVVTVLVSDSCNGVDVACSNGQPWSDSITGLTCDDIYDMACNQLPGNCALCIGGMTGGCDGMGAVEACCACQECC